MKRLSAMGIRSCIAIACVLATTDAWARAGDLCGRPRETPDALFQRLTRTEKLREGFRDKAYVTINDENAGTIWTFTVAGHPAHPSVVCRQPVEEGGKLRDVYGTRFYRRLRRVIEWCIVHRKTVLAATTYWRSRMPWWAPEIVAPFLLAFAVNHLAEAAAWFVKGHDF